MVKAWGGLGESLILTFDAWCSLCSSESNNVATLISTQLPCHFLIVTWGWAAGQHSIAGMAVLLFCFPGTWGRCICVFVCLVSCIQLTDTSWTIAHQAPLSRKFSLKEYWSGLQFPPPGDFPNPGIESTISYISCIGRQILYHWPTRGIPCRQTMLAPIMNE